MRTMTLKQPQIMSSSTQMTLVPSNVLNHFQIMFVLARITSNTLKLHHIYIQVFQTLKLCCPSLGRLTQTSWINVWTQTMCSQCMVVP